MSERQATAVFDAFCAGVLLVFFAFVMAGCAGQIPDASVVPKGGEVVAEQRNPFGSSQTTVKGGAPAVYDPETQEDALNKCLGRHPDNDTRLCGCLERAELEDTREFEDYCIDEREREATPPPPPARPAGGYVPTEVPNPVVIDLERSDGAPRGGGGKGADWARVEDALSGVSRAPRDNCISALTRLVWASGDTIPDKHLQGLATRTTEWVGYYRQAPPDWLEDADADEALSDVAGACP